MNNQHSCWTNKQQKVSFITTKKEEKKINNCKKNALRKKTSAPIKDTGTINLNP